MDRLAAGLAESTAEGERGMNPSVHFIDTRADLSTAPRGVKPIVVLKFGGSVLMGPDDLPQVVSEIYRIVRNGRRVIAVVSAFAGLTDRLLQEATAAGAPHDNVNAPAYVALGEETSAALLALACDQAGLCAIGLKSNEVGRVIAQVTAPVYDSVTGTHLLIPQGSRLIGTYENGVRYGDSRILLAWNRLILPNGWSINLREMSASDPTGASGLSDTTDNHFGRLATAIGLSAIISVIANESEDEGSQDDASLSQGVGDAAAQQAAQTGSQIVQRDLSVRPTLRIRPGASVRVLVTRDIQLRPYHPQ